MAGDCSIGMGFILVTPLSGALKALAGLLEKHQGVTLQQSFLAQHCRAVPSHSLTLSEGATPTWSSTVLPSTTGDAPVALLDLVTDQPGK